MVTLAIPVAVATEVAAARPGVMGAVGEPKGLTMGPMVMVGQVVREATPEMPGLLITGVSRALVALVDRPAVGKVAAAGLVVLGAHQVARGAVVVAQVSVTMVRPAIPA